MRIERVEADGEKVVVARFRLWHPVCIFLALWLTGWSLGCYKFAVNLVNGPFRVDELLFALPFFAGEIIVSCIVIMMIFGRTTIRFSRSVCTRFTGIGRLGLTKKFAFTANCEIGTDEYVTHGKHGCTTHYRLFVKASPAAGEPMEIYSSTDAARIRTLYDLAKEVADCRAATPAELNAAMDGCAEEDAAQELGDNGLFSARPPKGIAVMRDYEGRIVVVYRRIAWGLAFVLVLVLAGLSAVLWWKRAEIPLPVFVAFGFCSLFPIVQLVYALFGKRTMTLDHGNGETFIGVGGIGLRRRFEYGGSFNVRLADSNMWVNHERMREIVLSRPGDQPVKVCASWPNDVKPYLAAILRNPGSVAATITMGCCNSAP